MAEGMDMKNAGYQYQASVCSNMDIPCQDIMTGQTISGSIYQVFDSGDKVVCWDVFGIWDGTVNATRINTEPAEVPAGAQGIALQYNNGDECRQAARPATLNLICSPTA